MVPLQVWALTVSFPETETDVLAGISQPSSIHIVVVVVASLGDDPGPQLSLPQPTLPTPPQDPW